MSGGKSTWPGQNSCHSKDKWGYSIGDGIQERSLRCCQIPHWRVVRRHWTGNVSDKIPGRRHIPISVVWLTTSVWSFASELTKSDVSFDWLDSMTHSLASIKSHHSSPHPTLTSASVLCGKRRRGRQKGLREGARDMQRERASLRRVFELPDESWMIPPLSHWAPSLF